MLKMNDKLSENFEKQMNAVQPFCVRMKLNVFRDLSMDIETVNGPDCDAIVYVAQMTSNIFGECNDIRIHSNPIRSDVCRKHDHKLNECVRYDIRYGKSPWISPIKWEPVKLQ